MRQLLALTLALGAAAFPALADESSNGWGGLRPFIGAGYTWGGDTIQHWTYTPEGGGNKFAYQEDVSAGAGLDLRLGLSYRLGGLPLTLQASVSHHIDQTHGISSRAYFRRLPAELVLQYHINEQARLGIGVRRSLQAKFRSDGGTCQTPPCYSYNEKMESSTGVILEGEWLVSPSWGFKARYVHEDYRFKEFPQARKYEGDHFGVLTNYYFN